MALTKVTRNYQITLPKEIRKLYDIRVGDNIILVSEKEGVILRKIEKDPLKSAFGAWGPSKESSVARIRKLRKEGEKRMKRLGL